MRKQTKIAAIVSAAALLALGASMTSFAASKGTWMMVDGEWQCYGKNGDAYENTFCSSNGKEYYVGEDGQLVRSSWVEYDSSYYFVNSSGAKITNDWRLTTPYDDDSADEDEYWYYLKKTTGKPATGKQSNINGQIYLFNNEGQMQHGWVAATDTNGAKFVQLDKEDDEKSMSAAGNAAVYYCGDEDDGHAKKNKWTKTWPPDNTSEEDDDKEWFWFDKDGVLFRSGENKGSATASDAWKYKLDEGTLKKDTNESTGVISKKKVSSKDYWSTKDGVMLSKFYLINDAMYYFGGSDDGSMKTGSQSIKDNTGDTYKFYFYTKDQAASYKTPDGKHGLSKGAGVVGNQGNKLYWYGLPIQADDYKYQVATITINGTDYSFIVNSNGTIQHSANTEYKEDGEVLVKTGAYTQKDKDGKDVVIPTTFVKDGQAKYAIEDTKTIKKDVIDVNLGNFFQ
ncbi:MULTISPECIES: hypothetical protein [Clostridiaceae]|uniref:hypothetical protein n=1 Tax=Clostridiaceae TaxID=31979 RepID=UPI001C03142C|nr:hypothetical protein [Clostridium sp. MCC328]MBS5272855.1 hypothetical protein [butyrate-producing bacterium]MBT9819620.1 hypothetical protein [Clostridium sp. MCC328]